MKQVKPYSIFLAKIDHSLTPRQQQKTTTHDVNNGNKEELFFSTKPIEFLFNKHRKDVMRTVYHLPKNKVEILS